MPLHLLPKKSWNVYAPQNVARVKADEAAAAAQEEQHEQSLRDHEAQARLARLRGKTPPSPPPEQDIASVGDRRRRRDDVEPGKQDINGKKKRRRLHGEDDTERDIRLAREEESHRAGRVERKRQSSAQHQHKKTTAASLTDHRGNIQLFAPPSTGQIRAEKNAALEEERKARKGQEGGQDHGMRLADAAGRSRHKSGVPWYASEKVYSGTEELLQQYDGGYGSDSQVVVGKNAFGRDEPSRMKRDVARLSAADPMAAMSAAQSQLKSSERERDEARREREADLEALRREQGLEEHMMKRRRRERREEDRHRSERHSRREDGNHSRHTKATSG